MNLVSERNRIKDLQKEALLYIGLNPSLKTKA